MLSALVTPATREWSYSTPCHTMVPVLSCRVQAFHGPMMLVALRPRFESTHIRPCCWRGGGNSGGGWGALRSHPVASAQPNAVVTWKTVLRRGFNSKHDSDTSHEYFASRKPNHSPRTWRFSVGIMGWVGTTEREAKRPFRCK